MVLFGTLKKNKSTNKNFLERLKDRAYSFFFDRLPYRVRRYLEDNGNKRIEKMWIYRQPIMSVIDKLFSILSQSKFDEMKKKLGYDDLYHLYMIVQLNDNTKAIIEKNQDINIGEPSPDKFNGDFIEINLKGSQPSLLELFENTKSEMKNNFYSYNSFTNNCQDWIIGVLKGNNLLDATNNKFVKQDVGELLKTLPSYTSTIANATTTTASYINRFLQSLGFK